MSAVETQNEQIAKLSAKLSDARSELKAATSELNDLRNAVADLRAASEVPGLKAKVDQLQYENTATAAALKLASDGLAKAQRDLAEAGPAVALVAAIKAL